MAKKQRKVLNITNLQAGETSVSNNLAFDKPRWLDTATVQSLGALNHCDLHSH